MANINRIIADELKVREAQIAAAVALLDEGAGPYDSAQFHAEIEAIAAQLSPTQVVGEHQNDVGRAVRSGAFKGLWHVTLHGVG